ncbi:PQQ-dependent sugar dehydrogenase [Fredinandcohnia sp. QZ13]|uniref:PQQ-dependent sugar dehydrogenase n=1 Tax=Fredinandcohnia sp. QZ13 TaxID=3073144 RepID=UPI00285337C4|nr:PQQ-dependent sugar dehydrogenase [Fredinandcohnia sp. QZ13]MDR4889398.1 PQQ-dependent sugar dehydrogenase [Fredinandcohnia sp. QZ13]
MKKLSLFLIFTIIVGCSQDETLDGPVKETVSNPSIIATNLTIPWMVTKTDGIIFIPERIGKLSEIEEASGKVKPQQLKLHKEIPHQGEGGLLGFTLAPDFQTSNEAFMYHTYLEEGNILNRVILVERNGSTWVEKAVLLEGIPGGRIHNGGRIKIGPDDKLYVTAGDAGVPENAQDLTSLAGKILRMNLDGSIPNDNPFPNSYVYTYGHRNPQGLAWDEKKTLYSTEHGQIAHDEINLVEPGKNYGWPIIEGSETKPDMVTPIYQTGEDTWAPSGIDYANGKLYIATLRGSMVRSYEIESGRIEVVLDINSRMRDVYIEDSTLYTITNNKDGRGNPKEDDDKLLSISLSGIRK